jgi:hypothetical protein
MINTHMLWAYGKLSNLEINCVKSFLNLGYRLKLWTYGDIINAPKGAELRDAREIIPEEMVFMNKGGSYAGFSDLFRYAVLSKHGGLWADTDVVALIGPDKLPKDKFLVTERIPNEDNLLINGNVIYNPTPGAGDIIDLALSYTLKRNKTDINGDEIGPSLLTSIVSIYPGHGFKIMAPEFANPINWWDCPFPFITPDFQLSQVYGFIHLFNERWRQTKTDKNSEFPRGSLMDLISRPIEIDFTRYGGGACSPIAHRVAQAHIHPIDKPASQQ